MAGLDAAAAAGWRRTWWPRRDPAFAALRGDPRFQQWLQRLDAGNAALREALTR
jgi:hypothetical protein